MAPTPKDAKAAPDWERIESDYRAGILSLREIAAPYEITEGAIRKRAKAKGWSRDLTAKIKARTEELVRKEAVRAEGTQPDHRVPEADIVEGNAQIAAAVDRRHKGTAKRGQALVDKLIAELEITTDNLEDFHKLGELLDQSGPNENGKWVEDKLNKIYHAVISTGGRVDSLKKLAETFEKFAKFERTAYRLEDGEGGGDTPDTPLAVDNETARRIAFILSKGLQAQKG
jgi:hypothetical protein